MSSVVRPIMLTGAVTLYLAACAEYGVAGSRQTQAVSSAPDTARIATVSRYTPPVEQDTVAPTITAFAVDGRERVIVATGDGRLLGFTRGGRIAWIMQMETQVRALAARSDRVVGRLIDGSFVEFNANGTLAARRRAGSLQGLASPEMIALDERDVVYLGIAPAERMPHDIRGVPLYVRIYPDGRVPDTLHVGASPDCEGRADASHFRSGSFHDIRVRFVPSLLSAVMPAGSVVSGCNATYELTVQSQTGSTSAISRPRDPVPVSAEEKSSFIAAWTLRMRNAEAGPAWSWTGALPDHKPAFSAVLAGPDGTTWIWPARPSRKVPAPPQWVFVGGPKWLWVEPDRGAFDVFAADGSLLGFVPLPEGTSFAPFSTTPAPVIRHGSIWAVSVDSTGQHSVIRARFQLPSRKYSGQVQRASLSDRVLPVRHRHRTAIDTGV